MKMNTICRLCSACCPVEVDIDKDGLRLAERKSFLPPGESLICPKLKAAADIVYSPARLKKPLVKDKKGSGPGFRETSWDEALDIIVKKFKYFKKEYGPQVICWLRGMAADWGSPWDYANRLMNAFGSPNTIGNGSVCHVARDMAHVYTYGAMTLPQPKSARCIVVWGKNDMNTCPPAFEAILYAKRQGAKLIVIDPLRTPLAEMADIWLQIKPGHDGPLAMSMIQEIITGRLYDEKFVEKFVIGFEELKNACKGFSADKIADRIWLNADRIKAAARLYAETSPACIIEGNGLDMQLQVFQATRAVCMLRALTGNLDKEGGDFIPQPVPTRNIQLKNRLSEHIRPITRDYPLFNEFHERWGLQVQSCLIDAILEEKPYPVKMLIVQAGNPAVTMTDSNRVIKSLTKLEFMVVIDLFLTRTARFADVVLPAGSCFEKTQLNRAHMRNSPVILQNRVIDSLGHSWPDWKIIFELGRRLGLQREFPWQTVEEAIDYQLEPAGMTVEMLRKNPSGLRFDELQYKKYQTRGFDTPSGKVEFFSERLRQDGLPPLPHMDGGFENPISFAEEIKGDAMIGISGERTNRFTHSQFHNIPALIEMEPEGFVDVHPDDAHQRGIFNGDMLKVETPRGHVRMKARISDVVHRGSIQIAWGWGEANPDFNLNNLTDDGRRNPITGTPSNRSFMCKIEKVIP
jgi:anaerobic selenocysteine-containing dehydrogenase